jgi:CRISPR-associated protein Csb1
VRTASRIDPLQIAKADDVELFQSEEEYWTFDPAAATKDKKGNAVKTKPSEVNHGNVAPTVSAVGGFTIQYAQQVAVLSFPALRRLRFPLDGSASPSGDLAGRVVVAALGLHAMTLLAEAGYDLRSRCLLVPVERTAEWLGSMAADRQAIELDPEVTGAVLARAVESAKAAGLPWRSGRIELSPSKKLVELVRRSSQRCSPPGWTTC